MAKIKVRNGSGWTEIIDTTSYLHFERADINKAAGNAANSMLGDVTAPAVSGYSFLAWVTVSTAEWVGACYFEEPLSATTRVWCAADTGTASGSVQCFALYVKNVQYSVSHIDLPDAASSTHEFRWASISKWGHVVTIQFSAMCLHDKPEGNAVQFNSSLLPAPADGVIYHTAHSGVRWYIDSYGNVCTTDACATGQNDWIRFTYICI